MLKAIRTKMRKFSLFLALGLLGSSNQAFALPQSPTVVSGDVTFDYSVTNQLTITNFKAI